MWNVFRSNISDVELDQHLRDAMVSLPYIGERLISGFFRTKDITVQRRRIRDAIRRVDPYGLKQRRELLHKRIRRRVYSVPNPHSLWHFDGNHKLIRWGLVIHCAIDGHSRACVYMKCSNNNRSETVLQLFESAIATFNVVPSRVRSDYGVENVKVWEAMIQSNPDSDAPCVLLGSSVHNQRVERFNREINRNVKQKFATIFYKLEQQGLLNTDCPLDLFALQYVFVPRLNECLTLLANCHNNHNVSTEGNQTPNQILSSHGFETPKHVCGDVSGREFQYNDSATPVIEDHYFEHLSQKVPPLTTDANEGCTVYEAVREFVHLYCIPS